MNRKSAIGPIAIVVLGASVASATATVPQSQTDGSKVTVRITATSRSGGEVTNGGVAGKGRFVAAGAIKDRGTEITYRTQRGALITLRYVTAGRKGTITFVVKIDTTGGPGFGFEHFKELDFLKDHEVVLTFDDGPWVENTPSILKTLAEECTTGIFFEIGKHATYYPEIAKQVYAAGHTIGTHTWSHATLVNKKLSEDQRKEEIEKGFGAVKWALGGVSPAPFFRFPALQHPPEMVTYLGTRNIAIFSCDLDSFDFKARNAKQVVDVIFRKLDKQGKGIILMHDFHKHTAEALPEILKRLKTEGYKVVAMRAKAPVQTLPQYDEMVLKEAKLPTLSQRPVSSVVTDVTQ